MGAGEWAWNTRFNVLTDLHAAQTAAFRPLYMWIFSLFPSVYHFSVMFPLWVSFFSPNLGQSWSVHTMYNSCLSYWDAPIHICFNSPIAQVNNNKSHNGFDWMKISNSRYVEISLWHISCGTFFIIYLEMIVNTPVCDIRGLCPPDVFFLYW